MTNKIDTSSFLTGTNGAFIEDMFERYLTRPETVDTEWQHFFEELGNGASAAGNGPSWAPVGGATVDAASIGLTLDDEAPAKKKSGKSAGRSDAEARAATLDSLRALMMIRAYRVRGHLLANLDPLGLANAEPHPELDPASYGFTEADLDRPIFIDNVLGLESATMREITAVLHQTYSGSIGYEFMHIQYGDQKSWIQQRIEGHEFQPKFTNEGRQKILQQLTQAEGFEHFLNIKYTGTKRFGIDGGESLIPLLEAINKRAAQLGVREINFGMPHRGRLNVLVNVMNKPYAAIFSEFQGASAKPDEVQGSGDVKYHLGTSADRDFDGDKLHLSLSPNPSHLEAVDPVVMGKTRAKQTQRRDIHHKQVMAVIMHGDAAFAGQGIIGEVFGFSDLTGYRTGGSIHIIVNNQIGFTTVPSYSRSTPYPSDVAKGGQAPIIHVNGDDPEAVVHAARFAADFRQEFSRDVVIDMFCYRRYGHNEGDEPAFTQPLMYRQIADHPSVREIYGKQLVEGGFLEAGQPEKMAEDFHAHLEKDFAATTYKPNKADWLEGKWKGLKIASGKARRGKTGVKPDLLKKVGRALIKFPEKFQVHKTVKRLLDRKDAAIETGKDIDWGTGEALAFGTLLMDGYAIRLSGQDSQRGTFSQRHSVLIDQATEKRYTPLNHIADKQAFYEVVDSSLSEYGVLGFEYGFSQAEPNTLTIWEGQFGDFANGAQIMFDQFIASGESKWLRMSGLVVLLPHGMEGQGPEHSSARPERFLQLCAEDNLQVANCTTSANYFHILRRQMHRDFRKPLILMTPKSLLRHKRAVSTLKDFSGDSTFHRILWDDMKTAADSKIKRVILCSGKVYFDLLEEREKRKTKDIQVLRMEQLYPFPSDALEEELGRFKNAEIMWCQEEHKNQGAWSFVEPLIEEVLTGMGRKGERASYVGRIAAAAPATGLLKNHLKQQAQLIDEALTF